MFIALFSLSHCHVGQTVHVLQSTTHSILHTSHSNPSHFYALLHPFLPFFTLLFTSSHSYPSPSLFLPIPRGSFHFHTLIFTSFTFQSSRRSFQVFPSYSLTLLLTPDPHHSLPIPPHSSFSRSASRGYDVPAHSCPMQSGEGYQDQYAFGVSHYTTGRGRSKCDSPSRRVQVNCLLKELQCFALLCVVEQRS